MTINIDGRDIIVLIHQTEILVLLLNEEANMTDAEWPPQDGLTTVNVPCSESILSVHASTRIKVPSNRSRASFD